VKRRLLIAEEPGQVEIEIDTGLPYGKMVDRTPVNPVGV
jgi:hypothetical protein